MNNLDFKIYIQALHLRHWLQWILSPKAKAEDDGYDSWNPTHVGDGLARQNVGNSGATSSFEGSCSVTRPVSIDSFDSKWYWFDVFNLVPGIDLLIIRNIQYFFLFAVNLGRD